MRTVETTATISEDRHLTVLIPPDVPLGTYKILVVLEEPPALIEDADNGLDDFPVIDLGPWPENLSLRREDMYDDWGR
jgi:hypothetical protein